MMKGLFGIFPTDHIRDLGIGEISLKRDSCHLYLKTLIIIIIIIIIIIVIMTMIIIMIINIELILRIYYTNIFICA